MTASLPSVRRPRRWISVAAFLVIALGLATRADLPLPALIARYGGDTLYATLIYLLLAWLRPHSSIGLLFVGAWGICIAIEVSQLIHLPWLEALRATLPGRLVLGAGFLWSDILCYGVGAALGLLLDRLVLLRASSVPKRSV
ncbi:MAG: DUF2809 domain-containing protein [Oscillochloris sp.]|nr:DUF2809 domain-containing protein [Oscillochloris sp.]